jgi:hypothetical protein
METNVPYPTKAQAAGSVWLAILAACDQSKSMYINGLAWFMSRFADHLDRQCSKSDRKGSGAGPGLSKLA